MFKRIWKQIKAFFWMQSYLDKPIRRKRRIKLIFLKKKVTTFIPNAYNSKTDLLKKLSKAIDDVDGIRNIEKITIDCEYIEINAIKELI